MSGALGNTPLAGKGPSDGGDYVDCLGPLDLRALRGREDTSADFEELLMSQASALRAYLKSARNPTNLAESSGPDITVGFRA